MVKKNTELWHQCIIETPTVLYYVRAGKCNVISFRIIAVPFVPVYDVSRKETFENIRNWHEDASRKMTNSGKDVVKILVGNKIDRPRVVSQESAAELAQSLGMIYRETSVKNDEGVTEVLNVIVEKVSCCLSVSKGCPLRTNCIFVRYCTAPRC